MSEFPTITLSACEDDDDEDEGLGVQRDSVMQVGEVGLTKDVFVLLAALLYNFS